MRVCVCARALIGIMYGMTCWCRFGRSRENNDALPIKAGRSCHHDPNNR